MPVNVACPACQRVSTLPDQVIGQPWRCPYCQVVVPGSTASPVTAAPLPAGAPGQPPDLFADLPTAPPSRTSPVIWMVVGAGCLFGFCMIIIVSLAAIQFLGQQSSTTFSTIGTSIEDFDEKPRKR